MKKNLTIRVDDELRKMIEEKAEANGSTITDVLIESFLVNKKKIIYSYTSVEVLKETTRIKEELNRIGVNLNQAVRKMNYGDHRWLDVEKIKKTVSKIENDIDKIKENIIKGE